MSQFTIGDKVVFPMSLKEDLRSLKYEITELDGGSVTFKLIDKAAHCEHTSEPHDHVYQTSIKKAMEAGMQLANLAQ